MIIRKIFLSILFLILSLNVLSCKTLPIKKGEEQETQIRIVDVNGKYRPINRQTPALNLHFQKLQEQQVTMSTGQNPVSQNVSPQNKQENVENFNANFGPSSEPLANEGEIASTAIPYSDKTGQEEIEIEIEEKEVKKSSKISKTINKGTFIQIGYYRMESGANKTLNKGKKFSTGIIKEIKRGKKTMYKTLLGPVKNQNEARTLLRKAKNNGFKDAFITKIK